MRLKLLLLMVLCGVSMGQLKLITINQSNGALNNHEDTLITDSRLKILDVDSAEFIEYNPTRYLWGNHTLYDEAHPWRSYYYWGGIELVKTLGVELEIISSSKGGQSISYWEGESNGWLALSEKYEMSGWEQADMVWYLQGEHDAREPEVWWTRLQALRNRMIDEGMIGGDAIWVIHTVSPHIENWEGFNEFVLDESNLVEPFVTNDIREMPISGDNVHYTTSSFDDIGVQTFETWYEAYQEYLSTTLNLTVEDDTVSVSFNGNRLYRSSDLHNWTELEAETSPFMEELTEKFFYKTSY